MEIEDRIWHPYTRFSEIEGSQFPTITRGEGIYLFDDQGNRFVDAISSWWACSLGHGHPRIIRAIRDQTACLQHSILGNLSHPTALALAQRLSDVVGGHRHVHFASDGSAAIEAALKIAVQYHHNLGRSSKYSFLTLADSYHGDTLGAVSVGYTEAFHRTFKPLLFKTLNTQIPNCTLCKRSLRAGACSAPCFETTEHVLRKYAPQLAGVVVEPLCQGTAGMRMYGAGYLARLAKTCRDLEIVLIVDEIATGFGKTGQMFAFEHAQIRPDIVCVGKALSAGYLPISAAIVSDEIYNTFNDKPDDHSFYHGHTFAGNPIAAAAALATLDLFAEEQLVARGRELGHILEQELQPLSTEGYIRDVRCLGIIGAIELGPDEKTGRAHAQRVRKTMLDRNILLRPLGSVVYLLMPLTTPGPILRDTTRTLVETIQSNA